MIDFNLPMEFYLGHPGIGSSLLKKINQSPADFKAAWENGGHEDTKYTILGEAVHTAILEPDYLHERFAMQPEDWGPKNVGQGAKLWREFKKDNAGKKIIDFSDAKLIQRINEAARKHNELSVLLDRGRPEVTSFALYDQKNGKDIWLKARTDLLIQYGDFAEIWDVKTTSEDISDANLFNIIFRSGYHFQAAHHSWVLKTNGCEVAQCGWIFVSTQTPAVHIRLVSCPQELLEWGRRDFQCAIENFAQCLDTNKWPGLEPIAELQIPEWARKLYA